MRFCIRFITFVCGVLAFLTPKTSAQTQAPILVHTSAVVRVMAANLTSGNNQRYETPGINILRGLKPDVVAIQEFNYSSSSNGVNTAAALREFVDKAFGPDFVFFRETGKSIPNGIVSRFRMLQTGIWEDPQVPDREFPWALLDLPGTNDLYVVSVHLHSGGGSSSRAIEATVLTNMIRTTFPANALVVLAGDLNTDSRLEAAIDKLTSILSDSPIPTDAVSGGDPDTNQNRNKPYDYVLPSFSLATHRVPSVVGSKTFTNGLVFDSRVFTPLSEVAPVSAGDSGASMMQHMAVIKDFRIPYTITNFVTVPAPTLVFSTNQIIRWQGLSNVAYSVEASSNLPNFFKLGGATSSTATVSFTNRMTNEPRLFFRVVHP